MTANGWVWSLQSRFYLKTTSSEAIRVSKTVLCWNNSASFLRTANAMLRSDDYNFQVAIPGPFEEKPVVDWGFSLRLYDLVFYFDEFSFSFLFDFFSVFLRMVLWWRWGWRDSNATSDPDKIITSQKEAFDWHHLPCWSQTIYSISSSRDNGGVESQSAIRNPIRSNLCGHSVFSTACLVTERDEVIKSPAIDVPSVPSVPRSRSHGLSSQLHFDSILDFPGSSVAWLPIS